MESLILFPFPVSRSLRGLQGLLCDAGQHEAVDDTGYLLTAGICILGSTRASVLNTLEPTYKDRKSDR